MGGHLLEAEDARSGSPQLKNFAMCVHLVASLEMKSLINCQTHSNSGFVVLLGSGSVANVSAHSDETLFIQGEEACGCVSAIFHELVLSVRFWNGEHLLRAPPVFGQRLPLHAKNRGSAGLRDASCEVTLRTGDVARRHAHHGSETGACFPPSSGQARAGCRV